MGQDFPINLINHIIKQNYSFCCPGIFFQNFNIKYRCYIFDLLNKTQQPECETLGAVEMANYSQEPSKSAIST